MDPVASAAAASAIDSEPKKQPKARKPAKHLTPIERRKEFEKRAGRREAIKNSNVARLEEERRLETERFLAAQALANNEKLMDKAAVRAAMTMKQEVLTLCLPLSPTPTHLFIQNYTGSAVQPTPSNRLEFSAAPEGEKTLVEKGSLIPVCNGL
jgi:hypothetical protein